MKETIIDLKDLDDLTIATNLLLHHREADRYAKDKSIAKRKLFNSETSEEFFKYKKRFKQIEASQTATISLRDSLYIELKTRGSLEESLRKEPLVLISLMFFMQREMNEAKAATQVSKTTKKAREFGVFKARKLPVADKEIEENKVDAKAISFFSINAGESREKAKNSLKRFYSKYGNFMRMEMPE